MRWIHLTLVFASMLQNNVFSISFTATRSIWSAGYFLPSYSSHPSEKERSKGTLSKDPVCTQFCQKTKRGYNWGSMLHPERRPPALTSRLSEQEARSLAFGHAELRDLLPPGQILFVFCSDVNTESCNRVTPKIRIHVHSSL